MLAVSKSVKMTGGSLPVSHTTLNATARRWYSANLAVSRASQLVQSPRRVTIFSLVLSEVLVYGYRDSNMRNLK